MNKGVNTMRTLIQLTKTATLAACLQVNIVGTANAARLASNSTSNFTKALSCGTPSHRPPELGQLHQRLGLEIPKNTNQTRTGAPKVTVRERADPKFSINFQSSIRGDLYQFDWLIKVWLHQSGSVRG